MISDCTVAELSPRCWQDVGLDGWGCRQGLSLLSQTCGLSWLAAEPGACRCLRARSSAKLLRFITVELGDLPAICLQLPAELGSLHPNQGHSTVKAGGFL